MHINRLRVFLVSLSCFACEFSNPEIISDPPDSPITPAVPIPFMGKNEIDPGQLGTSLAQHAPIAAVRLTPKEEVQEDPYRTRRRMDLDQLNAAIKTVTGGLEWTVSGTNQFVSLASTLGKPDFATITQEDLDTTAMFLKFLGDAARNVCFRLVDDDVARPVANRVLFKFASPEQSMATNPEAIETNLIYLLKRYHGLSSRSLSNSGTDDAPNALGAELQQWLWLYQAAEHVSENPSDAWRTVCIALMTHPDFYLY
jgi:hypothetical protein